MKLYLFGRKCAQTLAQPGPTGPARYWLRGMASGVLLAARLMALWPGLPMGAAWAEGSSASGAEEGRAAFVLVGEGSWLNIRERPKAHAPVVLRLTRGDELTLYRIDSVMNGDLDEIIDALTLAEQTELLKEQDA